MKEEKIFYVLLQESKECCIKKKVIILREPLQSQASPSWGDCNDCAARTFCSYYYNNPLMCSVYSDKGRSDELEWNDWLAKPFCGDGHYNVLDCIIMDSFSEDKYAIERGGCVYPDNIIELFCKPHCSHYIPGFCCFKDKKCPMSALFDLMGCEIIRF